MNKKNKLIFWLYSGFTVLVFLFVFSTSRTGQAFAACTTGNVNCLNFQARLLTASGGVVPDGTYNVDFQLFTSSSADNTVGGCNNNSNTCVWEETYASSYTNAGYSISAYNSGTTYYAGQVVSYSSNNWEYQASSGSGHTPSSGSSYWSEVGTDSQITVQNGYLSVNLGAIVPFGSNINWSEPLYLGIIIGGTSSGSVTWDTSTMTPMPQLTGVPYAFESSELSTNNSGAQLTLKFASVTSAGTITVPDVTGNAVIAQTSPISVAGSTNISGSSTASNFLANASVDALDVSSGALNIGTASTTASVTIGSSTGGDILGANTSIPTGLLEIGSSSTIIITKPTAGTQTNYFGEWPGTATYYYIAEAYDSFGNVIASSPVSSGVTVTSITNMIPISFSVSSGSAAYYVLFRNTTSSFANNTSYVGFEVPSTNSSSYSVTDGDWTSQTYKYSTSYTTTYEGINIILNGSDSNSNPGIGLYSTTFGLISEGNSSGIIGTGSTGVTGNGVSGLGGSSSGIGVSGTGTYGVVGTSVTGLEPSFGVLGISSSTNSRCEDNYSPSLYVPCAGLAGFSNSSTADALETLDDLSTNYLYDNTTFYINSSGNAVFDSDASTSAFAIDNATGTTSYFSVDNNGGNVYVNNSSSANGLVDIEDGSSASGTVNILASTSSSSAIINIGTASTTTNISGPLNIDNGTSASGTIDIEDGSSASGTVNILASTSSSSAIINIGSTATTTTLIGVVQTPSITGDSQLELSGASFGLGTGGIITLTPATVAAHGFYYGGNVSISAGSGSGGDGSTTIDGATVTIGPSMASNVLIGQSSGEVTIIANTLINNTGTDSTTIGTGGSNIVTIGASTSTIGINGSITEVGATLINNSGTASTTIGIDGSSSGNVIIDAANSATTTKGVIIGGINSGYQTNLVLGESTTDVETATSCTTSINDGALYYNLSTSGNTYTSEIRTCDGASQSWTDVVTADQLGLLLFGVVADSGAPGSSTGYGDIGGIEAQNDGPCRVAYATSTTATVNPCIAYSGGRKVDITTTTTIAVTPVSGDYYHVCLSGPDGGPAISSGTTETNSLPAWSIASPILCLATITTSGTAITNVYDTRVFVGDQMTYTTASTATAPGWIVIQTGANEVGTTTTPSTYPVAGIIVASTGTASTNTINAIMVTGGPAYSEATASGTWTAGYTAQTTTTPGYANQAATGGSYEDLGLVVDPSAGCSSPTATTCQSSMLVDVSPH